MTTAADADVDSFRGKLVSVPETSILMKRVTLSTKRPQGRAFYPALLQIEPIDDEMWPSGKSREGNQSLPRQQSSDISQQQLSGSAAAPFEEGRPFRRADD